MLLHVMLSIQLTINFLYSTFYYERHHNSDRRYSHKSKNFAYWLWRMQQNTYKCSSKKISSFFYNLYTLSDLTFQLPSSTPSSSYMYMVSKIHIINMETQYCPVCCHKMTRWFLALCLPIIYPVQQEELDMGHGIQSCQNRTQIYI